MLTAKNIINMMSMLEDIKLTTYDALKKGPQNRSLRDSQSL